MPSLQDFTIFMTPQERAPFKRPVLWGLLCSNCQQPVLSTVQTSRNAPFGLCGPGHPVLGASALGLGVGVVAQIVCYDFLQAEPHLRAKFKPHSSNDQGTQSKHIHTLRPLYNRKLGLFDAQINHIEHSSTLNGRLLGVTITLISLQKYVEFTS